MNFNKNRMGLTLGSLFSLSHLLWVIIVALGFGQKILDSAHSYHFVGGDHPVESFTFLTALLGVIFAFICGYIVGWLFACIWNYFKKVEKTEE